MCISSFWHWHNDRPHACGINILQNICEASEICQRDGTWFYLSILSIVKCTQIISRIFWKKRSRFPLQELSSQKHTEAVDKPNWSVYIYIEREEGILIFIRPSVLQPQTLGGCSNSARTSIRTTLARSKDYRTSSSSSSCVCFGSWQAWDKLWNTIKQGNDDYFTGNDRELINYQ